MDTTAIEYFMEIASGRTFWDVSESRNISQSSVSKAISRLEDELGIRLFNREKRSVRLTPAGEIFYTSLMQLAPEFKKTLEDMEKYSLQKKLCIGIVPNTDLMNLDLRLLSPQTAQEFPDLVLTLEKLNHPQPALAALTEGKIDFLIGHRFSDTDTFCDYTPVYKDTLYAVLPKDHPLAGRETVDFSEIYEDHFLIRSTIIRQSLNDICEFLGKPLPPNVTFFEVPAAQLRRDHLISRISFGQGISLYFKSDLYLFSLNHVFICPVTGIPDFPIVVARKKGRKLSSWQEAFRKYLCDVIFSDESYDSI